MMQICALLCLTVGLSQASVRLRRGYEDPDFEFGIGSFSGLEIKQKPNDQLGHSNIGGNKETNKNFVSIGDIGNVGKGLDISLVRDKSGIVREFGVSENKSFGLHINTAASIGGTSAAVHKEATSIFNNSTHTSAAVQLGIGVRGSVSSSHESTHIENIKTTQNGNKNKLIVLLSSGSIAVSSRDYTSNIEKNSFSDSNTRSTSSQTSNNSNGSYNGYTSNSNTENGNIGYNINSDGYQHFGSTNNRDITRERVVGNHEQKYSKTAGQEDDFEKSNSLATSGSSDIIKATKIPLQERPLRYSTSQHDGIDDNRNFNIHTYNVRGVGTYGGSGTKDFVTIGSSFNRGFEKNVGGNFRNSEYNNANKQISGKNKYGISSGGDYTKSLDSVFTSNKRPEKDVIPIIRGEITHWDAGKDHSSLRNTGEINKDNYMNTAPIKNHRNSGSTHCHDGYFVTDKNNRNQEANSRNQERYKSNNEGQNTHFGDSESRVSQSINYPGNNRDDGLRSNLRGTGGAGSHLDVSDTYIHSASGHSPSHWIDNEEDKRQFGGNENHRTYWGKNGDYRRILENLLRKDSSEVYKRRNSGSSELHSAQSGGNVASNIYLKDTDNHGVSWNNRKRYDDNEGRENDRKYSNHRYGVTRTNSNRHDNAYIKSIGDNYTTNNKGYIYENNRSGGHLYGLPLHNVGSTNNIAVNHANNEGLDINWHNDKRHSTNHEDNRNYDHDSQKANIAKGYNVQSNTHERHHTHSASDESYRRHLTGTEYDTKNLGGTEGPQFHSTSHINNSENHRSNSGGHVKYPTDAIVHGSSSDNIGVFKGIPESINKEQTIQSVSNNNRENHRAASDSNIHQSFINRNQESNLGNGDGNSISSITNKNQGSYWGGVGVYGSHSSSNEGYKRDWKGFKDQKGYAGGNGRYASQWSDSVGYINQWNITGNHEFHSSGNAAYASHWADSTGQRSHSAGSVGYETNWGTSGEHKRYSSSDSGHGSH